MKKPILILPTLLLLCALTAGCIPLAPDASSDPIQAETSQSLQIKEAAESSEEPAASASDSSGIASENAASGSALVSSGGSAASVHSLPPKTGATEAENVAIFQELVDKVTDYPLSTLFFYDLMPGVRPYDDGLDLYKTGCGILGEEALKDTYQTGTINIGFGDEELFYTPAPVMEAALQQYFAFSAEDLHRMMASYDPEIDGYWAPYGGGGGGFTPITTVLSVEIDGTTAILSCENIKLDEFGQTDPEVPPVYSSVRMVHSETYGWRFAAILVE